MVDLPPSADELNEYGRFAFLNEMHRIASQIATFARTDASLYHLVKKATEIIEEEKKNLTDSFSSPYQVPSLRNVAALISRCAELYLASGTWFELARADVHLIEKDDEEEFDPEEIRDCFNDPNLTERFVISSPIIELTLTRIEMMKYFEAKQDESYKGPDPGMHDPFSKFKLPPLNEDTDIDLFNKSELPQEYDDPNDLVINDIEYLEYREKSIWSVLSDLRFMGSLATLIYYIIFTALMIAEIVKAIKPVHIIGYIGAGYGIAVMLIEIISMRMCFVLCFKPEKEIDCLYPGFMVYVVQYISEWIVTIVLALALVYQWDITSIEIKVCVIHQGIALFWPLITQCFLFKWHQRIERKFKWIRIKFFKSCWWTFYRIITYVLFTPGVTGVETLLISALKNKPHLAKMKEQQLLTSV